MKRHLVLIHLSRALVPLMVVLFHLSIVLHNYFGYESLPLHKLDHSGGVDFFFALSGFMAYYVYGHKLGPWPSTKRFLISRFIRIYPLYWLISLSIIPIFFFNPTFGMGYERDASSIIISLLLIPQKHPPILAVAWSLTYTVYLYLVFALCFSFKGKWRMISMLAWGLASASVTYSLVPSNFTTAYLFSPANLQFLTGIGCAYLAARVHLGFQWGVVLAIVGLAGFPLAWYSDLNGLSHLQFLEAVTVSSALCLFAFAQIDFSHEISLPRPLKFLGDASFSIYLTNFISLSLLAKTATVIGLFSVAGGGLVALVLAACTVAIGCAVYTWVEKPLLTFLKKKLMSKKPGVSLKAQPSRQLMPSEESVGEPIS